MPDQIPNDPLNRPVQTRPTPVNADTLFYEIVDGPQVDAVRLEYGDDYPDTKQYPGFKLVHEERLGLARARRWWSTLHVNQDSYNDSVDYAESAIAYPTFTRRYIVRRDQYADFLLTPLQPLEGILGFRVTATGSGYTEAPLVSFTGGTGSTAQARALINTLGEVCWVAVDEQGDYSIAPTVVFTGGGGTGATATAFCQPQTALLTKQRKVELPEDHPLRSIFVLVEMVYETLPGPETVEPGFDPITGALLRTYKQRVALPANPRARAAQYPAASGYYVDESVVVPDEGEGTVVGTLVTKVTMIPGSRIEYRSENEPMPSVFTYITGWAVPGPSYVVQPPWYGVHYSIDHHSPASPKKYTYHYYLAGTEPALGSGSFPDTYSVDGNDSKVFGGLSRYTLHGAYAVIVTPSVGSPFDLEVNPATVPASYTTGQTIVTDAIQKRFNGALVEQIVATVTAT